MTPGPRLTTRDQAEIFVGVDSSDCSRIALGWAAGLARRLGYRLHVVEAWEYPRDTVVRIGRVELPSPEHADALLLRHLQGLVAEVVGDTPAVISSGAIEVGAARHEPGDGLDHGDGTDAGDRLVATATATVTDTTLRPDDATEVATGGGLEITIDVLRGPASEALLHAADDRARMIVVGSRGLGGFRGLLLGSVSRQLCEHAPCPVTVVRNCVTGADFRLNTIAVGVDGSVNAQRAVRFAAELAEGTGAYVVAVHAAAPGTAIDDPVDGPAAAHPTLTQLLEGWCAPLERRGLDDHDLVVAEGDPRTALLDIAEERGADLIVVGSRGLGPVSKLVLGSVASSLIHQSPVPVTVVPPTTTS